jgi:flagellar motor component MotA
MEIRVRGLNIIEKDSLRKFDRDLMREIMRMMKSGEERFRSDRF